MKRMTSIILAAIVFALFLGVSLSNRIQTTDENITAAWSEMVNQFQQRAELIPNLVSTVKGFANHDKELLTRVVEARTRATSIPVNAEPLNNPDLFKQFIEAQRQLNSALSRLLMTVERYPELKSNTHFLALQTQLEETESRITVARKRYIDTVKDYNLTVRRFPGNLFDYDIKPNFSVANEVQIATPPTIKL